MRKKRNLIIIMNFLIILGLGYSLYNYVNNSTQLVEVYVFNKDMPVNTEISDSDIQSVQISSNAVSKEMALNKADIVGKYTSTDVFHAQYVMTKQVIEYEEVDPFDSMDMTKLRKFSIPVDYLTSFGGNVSRGDKVDLLYVAQAKVQDEQEEDIEFAYSKIFLQNIYVYSVTTSDGFAFKDKSQYTQSQYTGGQTGESIDTSADTSEIETVTLAVTLEQAEEIIARLETGTVRLVARFDDSISYETVGYVIGEYGKIFAEQANAETSRTTIVDDNQY